MLQPLGKRILIKPIVEEKKPSFIIVKDEAPQSYSVLAIGDDVTKVKVGDTIYIAAYSTAEIKYVDEKFQIVVEDNIIAKVI